MKENHGSYTHEVGATEGEKKREGRGEGGGERSEVSESKK